MSWFFRLPLLVRIPLLSATMIFLIAMVVTQMAIFSLSRQYEIQTERIGQVYLDGLSAAIEHAYQNRDIESINLALTQSLNFYLGVIDRQLALIDRAGSDAAGHIAQHVVGVDQVVGDATIIEPFARPVGIAVLRQTCRD